MTTPDRRPFTNAFIAMLETGTGRQVGDHASPAAPLEYPYCIVYAIEGGGFSGPPLWHPDEDATFPFSVRSVGLRRDQAEWMADRVRLSVLGRSAQAFQISMLAPAGWSICGRMSSSSPTTPTPEGVPPNQVWNVSEQFSIQVTPS